MNRCHLQLDFGYLKNLLCLLFISTFVNAQPTMETGGQKMPNEWIDKTTGHKVIRLTKRAGNNMSFYFHNNPFAGDIIQLTILPKLPSKIKTVKIGKNHPK